MDWKIFLSATAIAFAVLEVVSAFFIEAPVVAIVFAALFVLGAWLLRRFATVGVVVLAVLFVIELAGLPFYPRADTADRVTQTLALVIAIRRGWRRRRNSTKETGASCNGVTCNAVDTEPDDAEPSGGGPRQPPRSPGSSGGGRRVLRQARRSDPTTIRPPMRR